MKTIFIEVLVWAAVGSTVFFAWGMLRMRDAYQQIHYLSPPAAFAVPLLVIAIALQQGVKPETFKSLFIVLVLLAMNSIVSHATARAFRIREMSDWNPAAGQEVPVSAGDEIVPEHGAQE
jgi:multisubunit Na+/H+ antiporter MnhG subunit